MIRLLAISSFVFATTSFAQGVTYHQQIAPLLGAKCLGCHSAKHEGAPFSLTTYADVLARSEEVAEAIVSREMPPFSVDNSGSCGSFTNTSWLTHQEIAMVSDWVDAGAPEGDPSTAGVIPEPELGAKLDHVDAVAGMRKPYTPSADQDEIRCFLVDAPVNKDSYVTGFNVIAGDVLGAPVGSVHHVVLWIPDYWGQWIALYQDLTHKGQGYPCYSTPGTPAVPAAIWAPGSGAIPLPQGTGIQVPGHRKLILQVHYSPVLSGGNPPGPSQTRVELQLEKQVDHALEVGLAGRISGDPIPAHSESYEVERVFHIVPKGQKLVRGELWPFTLYGGTPHMHLFGHDEQLEVVRGSGESVCGMNVFRWEFGHQRSYFYQQPIELNPGDQLKIRCHFNTMSTDQPVEFGEGSDKEMCILGLFLSWQ